MKEKGMGRTRLGRFAAVTVPATALSLGFGFAIVNGAMAASLSASDPFKVKGVSATADGLELSLRNATKATSDTVGTADTGANHSALVTLANGKINTLKMCVDQPIGLPGLPVIGLVLNVPGDTALGAATDISATSVSAATANLGATEIGIAQSQLDHQSTVAGAHAGGFGLETTGLGSVQLGALNADAYALSLGGLNLASGLTIAPSASAVEATC
jgi:hypothetical protein